MKSAPSPYYATGRIGLSLVEIGNATAALEDQLLAERKDKMMAIEEVRKAKAQMQAAIKHTQAAEKTLRTADSRAVQAKKDLEVARTELADLQTMQGGCTRLAASQKEKIKRLRESIAKAELDRKVWAATEEFRIASTRKEAMKEALESYKNSDEFHREMAPKVIDYFDDGVDNALRVIASSAEQLWKSSS